MAITKRVRFEVLRRDLFQRLRHAEELKALRAQAYPSGI